MSTAVALGPGDPDITASMTIGNGFGNLYGYSPGNPMQFIPAHGSLTTTPTGLIYSINYSPASQETVITFTPGTYTGANGSLVVTDGETINGHTTYIVSIGVLTQTMSATPTPDSRVLLQGNDPFNLVGRIGMTVAIEITLA